VFQSILNTSIAMISKQRAMLGMTEDGTWEVVNINNSMLTCLGVGDHVKTQEGESQAGAEAFCNMLDRFQRRISESSLVLHVRKAVSAKQADRAITIGCG